MSDLPHLFPAQTGTVEKYTYSGRIVRTAFELPPRDEPAAHGASLVNEIKTAAQAHAEIQSPEPAEENAKGVTFDLQSEPDFKLYLTALDDRRSRIELRNARIVGNTMHATVFVPEDKIPAFVKKFEDYVAKKTEGGQPLNRKLVESVASIRLAAIESFWTDAGEFPADRSTNLWWEIWLREATNPHDVDEIFRTAATAAGMTVGDRVLKFPDRWVLLALGSVEQLLAIKNLFDILAEIRLAAALASDFVNLAPVDQAERIDKALQRIEPPGKDAPVVCTLDTGIVRGHPLLTIAIDETDVQSCNEAWGTADVRGHGTEMAGIALYGCLTRLFSESGPWRLTHRLESIKIWPNSGENEPELYGDLTSQAVSLAEIAAPTRQRRCFCLTTTAEGRDEGAPSSWSAAIDQIASGASEEGQPHRLIFISAGNTSLNGRQLYPDHNHTSGIEDPAQACNAVTIGAFTELEQIREPGYESWRPIAEAGGLSPSSRTSIIWTNRSWALKPDIVMEGGNSALNPESGSSDSHDDLSLLTTRFSPTGALLTTTGETSAATALAARYAAIIWDRYPLLWPETVRGLLIHSARWTDRMLQEFPRDSRHNRLRAYGFGVPNLQRALSSAENAATQIVQDSLQPYDKVNGNIVTKDMQLHRLPWPTAVLQQLGDLEIKMRVTLSYFIEPSPGRRGWTRKHRYQSHGLRFDIKRPAETEADFRKRITKAAWDEDEENVEGGADDRTWEVGSQLRVKGSVHSDTWSGTAAELAASGIIAVFPVTGWWRERHHLNRWNRRARYSLIATIETERVDADIYTPIANLIGVPVSIPISMS